MIEKIKRPHKLGQILFVNSNNQSRHNFFGVVVDDEFWLEEVKKEKLLVESRECENAFNRVNEFSLLRVLGTKTFRIVGHKNNPTLSEPSSEYVLRYQSGFNRYSAEIDLKPIIALRKNGRLRDACQMLFSSDYHVAEVLADANLIYKYMDGLRADDITESYKHYTVDFLKLLEKAIPL